MGAKTSKFISFAECLLLILPALTFAQVPTATSTPLIGLLIPLRTATKTATPQPEFTHTFTYTYTPEVVFAESPEPARQSSSTPSPTSTHVINFALPPWLASPTFTGTPGSPTRTYTPGTPSPTLTFTSTFTPTMTEGTKTPSATPTPTATFTPIIARSGLALFPTAYSNHVNHTDAFNMDMSFSYYIGSIAEKQRPDDAEYLNPLRLWLVSVDAKYGWLEEKGNRPAIASGFIDTLLLTGSTPSSTCSTSCSLKFTSSSMGSFYTVASKNVAKDVNVHLGYLRGNVRDLLKKRSKLLSRLTPNRNHSELLPLFTEHLKDIRNESAPNIIYTGWDFKFLGTFWRFELWKPFPLSKKPVLLNTKIDKLFSFNVAYERWQGGYAILGYFNFRFTLLPKAGR